jgi:hypothetical protein
MILGLLEEMEDNATGYDIEFCLKRWKTMGRGGQE